jgi:hypothetical protein
MDFREPLATITPTLDGDVLRVLARADAEMTGREIQRMAGSGSPQGIRNAADRLTAQGVVSRRLVGNAHLYTLNREHLASQWIEGLASLPEQLTQRLRGAVGAWKQAPVAALLFGSIARGEGTSDSDLDLLVVRPLGCDPDMPAWRGQIAELQEHATAWTGNDARVLEYGEDEFEQGDADPVLASALDEGIELFGSRRALRQSMKAAKR